MQTSTFLVTGCSYMGEALRAMLVLEVRKLRVLSQTPTQRVPAHLPPGCTALRCQIQTAGGATAQVVLGGPQEGMMEKFTVLLSAVPRPCLGCTEHLALHRWHLCWAMH